MNFDSNEQFTANFGNFKKKMEMCSANFAKIKTCKKVLIESYVWKNIIF